jgi:two-component system, NtrC family, response regulator AtoC
VSSPPPPPADPLTVLVVDDEEMVRRVALLMLREAGFHVLGATDTASALAVVRQRPVDVVLVDLHLGTADGRELVAALRDVNPALPAVLMSGSLAGDSLPAGVGYLTKPFRQDALVNAVKTALGG